MSMLPFPQPLSEKHRPRRVADFIGLAKPKKVAAAFVERPFASAWLFLGPSGTGKTSMALAIAESIPAELHHIPSQNCDLETVQRMVSMCRYVPMSGYRFHLILVDEADKMSPAAQLDFLSKMDATAAPEATIIIFTANDTRLLEQRFLSRCHLLEFEPAGTAGELPHYLAKIAKKEGYRFTDTAALAQASGSNVRDALMRLEVELLAGDKRGLEPATAAQPENEHSHPCPRCGVPWRCSNGDCALAYKSLCIRCGGEAKTVYHLRAAKAVATRTENIRRSLRHRRGAR
jgi:replication-associated recombination protein RarA